MRRSGVRMIRGEAVAGMEKIRMALGPCRCYVGAVPRAMSRGCGGGGGRYVKACSAAAPSTCNILEGPVGRSKSRARRRESLCQGPWVRRMQKRNGVKGLDVRCEALQGKGTKIDSDRITVGSPLGQGSFGQVFQGYMDADADVNGLDGEGRERVVLKRVKGNVAQARQVQEMEHVLNVYAAKTCARSVAPFVGYMEVEESVGKLTAGLWLVWKYEGDRTLGYYIRRRDCISELARDLELDQESDVVPTVMKQIFECLRDLHNAGLVHRDLKPANLVFSTESKRFKIIDLGAAADLRKGTNYIPSETMLDPCYCPPEEYVLPTDGPSLADQAGAVAMVMSPILWSKHRPECFDSYSAGVVLLQLALPFLRSPQALKNWRSTMMRLDNDVPEWRMRSKFSRRQTEILDADDGLGWSLVEGLLQPREVEGDGRGGVRFVTAQHGSAPRLTPNEALKHPFITRVSSSSSQSTISSFFGGVGGGNLAKSSRRAEEEQEAEMQTKSIPKKNTTWEWIQSRVFDLEAKIKKQASETEVQTAIVQQIKNDVKKGKATKEDLLQAESKLQTMQYGLKSSISELRTTFSSARSIFDSGLNSSSETEVEEEEEEEDFDDAELLEDVQRDQKTRKFLSDAASSAIYSSLKFTGRALIAIADLASTAEQSLEEAQSRREAIKKEKEILIELLDRFDINETSTWDRYKDKVENILDDSMLSEAQMKRTFAAYVEEVARAKRVARRQAKLGFGDLLAEAAITSSMSYAQFKNNYGTDPRFLAIGDDAERRAVFDTFMEEKEAQSKVEAETRAKEEQELLRAEYRSLEKKLRRMEKRFGVDASLDMLASKEDFMDASDDGAVTFKFAKEKLPPAKKNASK